MDRRVVRIEIEYEDGEIQRAQGHSADAIWTRLNAAHLLQQSRTGVAYNGPQLKPVPIITAAGK